MQWSNWCIYNLVTKIAELAIGYCWLIQRTIRLTSVIVSLKIFWRGCFASPRTPRSTATTLPPLVTPMRKNPYSINSVARNIYCLWTSDNVSERVNIFCVKFWQLTDVEAGGVTAFNLAGARVVPEKVHFASAWPYLSVHTHRYTHALYPLSPFLDHLRQPY